MAIAAGCYWMVQVRAAAALLTPWLLILPLAFVVPFAVLLLLIMPAGVVYAAVRGSPQGWAGRLTKVGCLVSMCFAVAYGDLMLVIGVTSVFDNSEAAGGDFSLTWRVGSLVVGLLATWRAWRWLGR